MARFKVKVTGDLAVEAAQALHGAGIPTVGPTMAGFAESPESWSIGDHLTAVIDVENPVVAERRVQEIVGPDYLVGAAEPWITD
jgi:hypothetical protein